MNFCAVESNFHMATGLFFYLSETRVYIAPGFPSFDYFMSYK